MADPVAGPEGGEPGGAQGGEPGGDQGGEREGDQGGEPGGDQGGEPGGDQGHEPGDQDHPGDRDVRGAGDGGGESLWEGWDSEFVTSWWVEGFTEGADAEYAEQILPMAAQHLAGAVSVLDVGCGEGQISRLAAALPGVARVVGVDPTGAQIRVAWQRGANVAYGRAAAAALPFPKGAFDTVVACLVFEHIDEVDAATAEVGRVLAPGGRFLLFLNHPLLQTPGSGWIDDRILDEQYWRIGPYLPEDTTLEQVDNGVWIPFIHRPLSRYVNALADAGLLVTRMEEPAPPPGFLERAHEYAEAASIPRLLFIRAEKVGGTSR